MASTKSLQDDYTIDIWKRNVSGSNRADSYIRALGYLGPILASSGDTFSQYSDIFSISQIGILRQLYTYITEQQKLGENGIFRTAAKPSYWRSGFYSAALKDYITFLANHNYAHKLWQIYNTEDLPPDTLAAKLSAVELESDTVPDEGEASQLQGEDVLREVKTRRNQHFFRSMIMCDYTSRCCLTGLAIPEVLRASHISSWATDETNRMNPTNGLCLSATYDAAFDRHLISFDEDYRFILSKSLRDHYTDAAFRQHFLCFEGVKLTLPKRFHPAQFFLEKHRNQMT